MGNKIIGSAINQLRQELKQIEQIIHLIETLASGKPRRGRPPKIVGELLKSLDDKTKKQTGTKDSAASRKKSK